MSAGRARAFAAAVALAVPGAGAFAGELDNVSALGQGEYRALSEDLAAAFSYKAVAPASPLGILGFDVGVEASETRTEHAAFFARAGAGGQSRLLAAKLHVQKGLPGGFDVGAFAAAVPDLGASVLGAQLRYAILDDGVLRPALGVRLAATRAFGLGEVELATASLDVTVSKRFALATPYIGAGTVRVRSSSGAAGLADENFDRTRVFGGLGMNLAVVALAVEAEKMGGNLTLSARIGWRF